MDRAVARALRPAGRGPRLTEGPDFESGPATASGRGPSHAGSLRPRIRLGQARQRARRWGPALL